MFDILTTGVGFGWLCSGKSQNVKKILRPEKARAASDVYRSYVMLFDEPRRVRRTSLHGGDVL